MIPPCLTLSIIRYVSRLKWSNPGKGVMPSTTARCSSYWKGSLLVALDYGSQLYFFYRVISRSNNCFDWVLWHINCLWLFNAKSSSYIYIQCTLFGLVSFYDISTIVAYQMTNHVFTYISNIWFVNKYIQTTPDDGL